VSSDLEKVVALARSEAADKLDERRGVRMSDASIHVDTDLIDAIHKLQIQWLQQLVLHILLCQHANTADNIDASLPIDLLPLLTGAFLIIQISTAERHKSDGVLTWLSVWSVVQTICIWSS